VGIYKPNKTAEQQNKTSYRVNCLWHININKNCEGMYEVTTFVNEHRGHTLNPQTVHFSPQFQKLTEEMLEDIHFWTLKGNLKATKQYQMLVSKYKCCIIKKDLYNAIYMV